MTIIKEWKLTRTEKNTLYCMRKNKRYTPMKIYDTMSSKLRYHWWFDPSMYDSVRSALRRLICKGYVTRPKKGIYVRLK